MASETKKIKFFFCLILISRELSIHMWLVAMELETMV